MYNTRISSLTRIFLSCELLQGALEEAQLITWPTIDKVGLINGACWVPHKLWRTLTRFCVTLQAFMDTILVLAIVTATGAMLLGVNVLLAEASDWWYHRG